MLDPRTKLALAFATAIWFLAQGNIAVLALSLGVLALLVLALRAAGRLVRAILAALAPTLLAIGILGLSAGPTEAVMAGLRLGGLVSVFALFFHTTPPEDLAGSLARMGLPFPLAFMFSATMQFVPVMSRKLADVADAQRARGIRLERDLASLPNLPALLAPLLIQAFKLAEELAEAMEVKGFGRAGRTSLGEFRLRRADLLGLLLAAGILIAALWGARRV